MKRQKQLSALLTACVLLTTWIVPNPTAAAEIPNDQHVWSGESDTAWFDGTRTSYDIGTPEQLAGLSQLVAEGNSMRGITINLISDIVMNDTDDFENWETAPPENLWIPIGNEGNSKPFSGLFNGNGHTIEGLYTAADDAAGLFGFLYCAGVVQVVMQDCFVLASFTENDVYAGGIAALADGAVISECEFSGKVFAYAAPDNSHGYDSTYLGGIVGACTISSESIGPALAELMFMCMGVFVNPVLLDDGSGGMIKSCLVADCINYGDLNLNDASFACYFGGIAGYGHTGKIVNSAHLGSMHVNYLNGNAFSAGGIVGMLFNCTMDRCCYATNTIPGVGVFEPSAFPEQQVDNAVKVTADELGTMDAASLEEMLGDAYAALDGRVFLKHDRRIWNAYYGTRGDVNQDGACSVADAVLLHKYLMTMPDTEAVIWQTADLYEDGKLNIRDLTLLKRQLLLNK